MPSSKCDRFLESIIKHVKFPFDRAAIRLELESHLSDKIEDYTRQGYDMEEAEQLSIRDMGDAREIGLALNKEHNPFLGWLWKITNGIVVVFAIIIGLLIVLPFIYSLFSGSLPDNIPKADIVYSVDVDETVKLDDTIIRFTKVVYEKDRDLHIFYEYYDTRLWGKGWSLGTIGIITDDLGNTYFDGSGHSAGGIKSRARRTVENFSKDANTVIISYDAYNRAYRVEIPLKAGEIHE